MADIRLVKPAAGASETVTCAPEARFVFDFPTTDATLARDGDNLNISFEDGSKLQLEGFYQEYNSDNLPSFSIDGTEVAAADFFEAMNEPDLMPAAGPGTGTVANGARFHEWGDSALTGGIQHLDGLDWGFSRNFEWEDHPNAVGYNDDGGDDGPGNTVPEIDTPPAPEPPHGPDGSGEEPGAYIPNVNGASVVVDEGALAEGSGHHTLHGAGGTGAFVADVHAELGGSIVLEHGGVSLVLAIPQDGSTVIRIPAGAQNTFTGVNGVDITILGATSDGNGKWTVTYEYTLTGPVEHDKAAHDTVLFDGKGIAITVTDGTGDVTSGRLTVEVHDDEPHFSVETADAATSLEGGFGLSFGADTAAEVDSLTAAGAISTTTSDDGKTIIMEFDDGTLTITDNGNNAYSYSFAPKGEYANENLQFRKDITLTATDRDGDTDTLTITVGREFPPTITTDKPGSGEDEPVVDGTKITVDEADLDGGTGKSEDGGLGDGHDATGSSAFSVNLHGEKGSIVIEVGGQKVTFDIDATTAADHLTVTPTGNAELAVNGVIITFTEAKLVDGQWQVNYKYQLDGNVKHDGKNSENVTGAADAKVDTSITITVTDSDGLKDTASMTVEVHDDGPKFTLTPGTELTLDGEFGLNFGADGQAAGVDSLTAKDAEDGSAPKSISVEGNTITMEFAEGKLIITNEGDTRYSYAFEPNDKNLEFSKPITLTATDGDKDTASITITVGQKMEPTFPDGTPEEDKITVGDITVDEGLLDTTDDEGNAIKGSGGHTEHGLSNTGFFTVDMHGENENGSITVFDGTNTVEIKLERDHATIEPGKVLHINGVDVEITKATLDGTEWKVEYKYTLTKNVEHKNPEKSGAEDSLTEQLKVTATDDDGKSTHAYINVNVHDDAPVFDNAAYVVEADSGETSYSAPGNFTFDFTNFSQTVNDKGFFQETWNQATNGSVTSGNGAPSHLVGNTGTVNFNMTASFMHYQYEQSDDGTLHVKNVMDISSLFNNSGKAFASAGTDGVAMGSGRADHKEWNSSNGEFSTGNNKDHNGGDPKLTLNTNAKTQQAMLKDAYGDDALSKLYAANIAEGIVFDLNDIAYGIELNLGSFESGDRVLVTFVMTAPYNDDNHVTDIVEINYNDLFVKNENGQWVPNEAYSGPVTVRWDESKQDWTYSVKSPDGFTKAFVSSLGSQKYDVTEGGLKATLQEGAGKEDSGFTIKGVAFMTPHWQTSGRVHADSADGIKGYTLDTDAFPDEVYVKGMYAGNYEVMIKESIGENGARVYTAKMYSTGADKSPFNAQTLFILTIFADGHWEYVQNYEFALSAENIDTVPPFKIEAEDGDGDTTSCLLYLNGDFAPFDEVVAGYYDPKQAQDPQSDTWDDTILGLDGNSLIYGKGGDDLLLGDSIKTDNVKQTGDEDIDGIVSQITGATPGHVNQTDGLHSDLASLNPEQLGQLADTLEQYESKDDDGVHFGGDDLIYGGKGNDIILGMGGDDRLYGEAGDDFLFGGSGDDYLNGGAGKDYLLGGSGNDLMVYDANDYLVDGGDGIDFLLADKGTGNLDGLHLNDLLGNDKAGDMPIVNGVEVLLKGVDATSLTSMKELAEKFGLRLEKGEDGQDRLMVDTDQWTRGETADGVTTWTNKADESITMETNLQQTSEAEGQAVLSAKVASEAGGN